MRQYKFRVVVAEAKQGQHVYPEGWEEVCRSLSEGNANHIASALSQEPGTLNRRYAVQEKKKKEWKFHRAYQSRSAS